jgi:hypothetical protein
LRSNIDRDSLKTVAEDNKKSDPVKNRKPGTWLGAVLWGRSKKINRKLSIDFAGIPKIYSEYNFVDGFRLGQKLTLTYNYNKDRSIKFTPSAYYTTARRSVVWTANTAFSYSPMRNGDLSLLLGDESTDYAGANGTNRFINSAASIVFAENTVKFYQRKYIAASNHVDIANGLRLHTEVYYARRNELNNNTSFNFSGRTPNSNLPHGFSLPDPSSYAVMRPHNVFSAFISIQYTPRYYYYIRNNRKHYSHSDYPTFLLSYKKAFAGGKAVNPSYDKLELTISQQIKTDIFSRILYSVNAGVYLDGKTTYLPDYNHFNTNELFITDKFLYSSFALPDNYIYATNKKWLQAHVSYNSDYLLIKRLPFLQNYLMTEDFHLKTLFLPGMNYSEIGYSAGLGSIGRIGVFVGFDDWKYKSTGIVVSLPILNN